MIAIFVNRVKATLVAIVMSMAIVNEGKGAPIAMQEQCKERLVRFFHKFTNINSLCRSSSPIFYTPVDSGLSSGLRGAIIKRMTLINAARDQEDAAFLQSSDRSAPPLTFEFTARKADDVIMKPYSGVKLGKKSLYLDYGPTCRFEGLEIVLDVGENFCRIQWREEPTSADSQVDEGAAKRDSAHPAL